MIFNIGRIMMFRISSTSMVDQRLLPFRFQIRPMNKYRVKIGEEVFTPDIRTLDLKEIGEREYHLIKDNRTFHLKVLSIDTQTKKVTISVNGNTHVMQIEDELDQMIAQLGLSAKSSKTIKEIKAPMPGLILDILVEPGQQLQKGSQLVILEAMKMENILKAEGESIVKSIEVTKGASVDKGQVLIEME